MVYAYGHVPLCNCVIFLTYITVYCQYIKQISAKALVTTAFERRKCDIGTASITGYRKKLVDENSSVTNIPFPLLKKTTKESSSSQLMLCGEQKQ